MKKEIESLLIVLPVSYSKGDPMGLYLHGWSIKDLVALHKKGITKEMVVRAISMAMDYIQNLPGRTHPKEWTSESIRTFVMHKDWSKRPYWKTSSGNKAAEDLNSLLRYEEHVPMRNHPLRNTFLLAVAASIMHHDGRSKAAKIADARAGIRPKSRLEIAEKIISLL